MSQHGVRRPLSPRSPLWAKLLIGVGGVLMVLAAGTIVYANVLLNTIDDSVNQTDLLGDGDEAQEIEGPLNLLIVGTDLRVNDSDGQDRADTIMIMHINEAHDQATLVSIPRDFKVEIEDCGVLFSSPCTYKINSSYNARPDEWDRKQKFGNLAKTVSSVTGIEKFHGAAILGFEGFLNAVKTFGGIELCLPFDMYLEHQKLENPDNHKLYEKGCKEYNHTEALYIVRERYAYNPDLNPNADPKFGVGDYGRQRMQQHFIKQLLVKAGKEGYTSNPGKITDLIEQIGPSLDVDVNGSIPEFALAMRNIEPGNIDTIRLPTTTSTESFTGQNEDYETVVPGSPEEAIMNDLFTALREDTLDKWIKANPDLVSKGD
ncbi:LCP family protein [Stackebrandtia soli]|uniref:LCP family protein n=1 Tax=Stackebrandtia soli TaxID=1892856 RepID=UPI0039EADE3D